MERKRGKKFWGPQVWSFIHTLAALTEPPKVHYYEQFLKTLTFLLPCDYCKNNLKTKLTSHPFEKYKGNSRDIFIYSYMLHDITNKQISCVEGVKKYSPPFDKVYLFYLEGIKSLDFIENWLWATLFIFSASFRGIHAEVFMNFLFSVLEIIPNGLSTPMRNFMNEYHINPYLRNNQDLFFYFHMMNSRIRQDKNKSPIPFQDTKHFYFWSLGKECENCNI